jgi:predicted dehydrogenase
LAQHEHALPDSVLFHDFDTLFTAARPECVIVATTADSHCALTCRAAERGARYILVEKPMAVSLAECDRMIEVCERHGAKLAVNHQMRFMEQYTEPKRLSATDAYGGLTSMTVVAGNFGFAMNGTHYFEAFRFLADEPPVEVTAWFSPGVVANPRGIQFEDRAGCIRAVTRTGRRLYMEIGADQGQGIHAVYACRNGLITVNELTGELFSTEREEQYRSLPTSRYAMPAVNTRRAINPAEVIDTSAAVLAALLHDVNRVSGEDGRRVVETLVAAYESAERGSVPVRVNGTLDRSRVFPWA